MNAFKLTAIVFLTLATAARAQDAQKALDRFKSMAGEWQGKDAKGSPVEESYQITAGGTAVMSENKIAGEEMLSLFYLDGDRLLMTHFCPSGNQPRMKASVASDGKSVVFDFLDATNLPDMQTGHMSAAAYTFIDSAQYTEEWTWSKGGKSTVFHLEMQRKK
jgi:hypothetical protein